MKDFPYKKTPSSFSKKKGYDTNRVLAHFFSLTFPLTISNQRYHPPHPFFNAFLGDVPLS